MKKHYLLYSLLPFFLSCSGGSTDSDCLYNSFPVTVRVNNAVDEEVIRIWNFCMQRTVFEASDTDGIAIESESFEGDITGRTTKDCIGGEPANVIIHITDEFDPGLALYESTVAHELGHVLGMMHTDYGIMTEQSPLGNIEAEVCEMLGYFRELY